MSQQLLDISLPCKNCLCLPRCRHKQFFRLFAECSILYRYVPNSDDVELRNEDRLFLLQKIMKPTIWEFGYIPNYPYQKHACLYLTYKIPYLIKRDPEI